MTVVIGCLLKKLNILLLSMLAIPVLAEANGVESLVNATTQICKGNEDPVSCTNIVHKLISASRAIGEAKSECAGHDSDSTCSEINNANTYIDGLN